MIGAGGSETRREGSACSLRPWRSGWRAAATTSGGKRERPALAPCRQRRLSTCDAGVVFGSCDRRVRRRRSPRRLHGHLARIPVAGPADAHCLPRALLVDARQIARGGRFLGEPAYRPPSGSRPPLQRPQRGAWAPALRWRAMDHALDGRPVLADALAAFDCLVEEVIERHSHAIVLGAVVSLKEGLDSRFWRAGAGTMLPWSRALHRRLAAFAQAGSDQPRKAAATSRRAFLPPPSGQQSVQMLLSMRLSSCRMVLSSGVGPDACGTPGRGTVAPVPVR